jgi:hypothetical protein
VEKYYYSELTEFGNSKQSMEHHIMAEGAPSATAPAHRHYDSGPPDRILIRNQIQPDDGEKTQPGLTVFAHDFCYRGHGSPYFVESIFIRFFAKLSSFTLMIYNHRDSIIGLKETLVREVHGTPQDSPLEIPVGASLRPGDCLGWYVRDYDNRNHNHGDNSISSDPTSSEPLAFDGLDWAVSEGEWEQWRYQNVDKNSLPTTESAAWPGYCDGAPETHKIVPRKMSFTTAIEKTGMCRKMERLDKLVGYPALAVSDCPGLLVKGYRITPSIKWCYKGEEVFTMRQKVETIGSFRSAQSNYNLNPDNGVQATVTTTTDSTDTVRSTHSTDYADTQGPPSDSHQPTPAEQPTSSPEQGKAGVSPFHTKTWFTRPRTMREAQSGVSDGPGNDGPGNDNPFGVPIRPVASPHEVASFLSLYPGKYSAVCT